jgi:hypothetical protein
MPLRVWYSLFSNISKVVINNMSSTSDIEQQPADVLEKVHNTPNERQSASQTATSSERPQPIPAAPAHGKTRESMFLIFNTLSQLVQMIPLGLGVNAGLAIGKSLGVSSIQSV